MRDAEQALAAERYDEALKLADRCVAATPADARGHFLIGVIHAQQGQWEKALSAYDQAIRLDPSRAISHVHDLRHKRRAHARDYGRWHRPS